MSVEGIHIHVILLPRNLLAPEENLSPTRFQTGPSGEWSAGIHFG